MISLADFEPLSVAKINIFFINNGGYTEKYFSDKVHAILLKRSWYKLRCVTAPVSVDSQV